MTFWGTVWASALGITIAAGFWQGLFALVNRRRIRDRESAQRAIMAMLRSKARGSQ